MIIKTSIVYLWLKPKIYLKRVPVMGNDKLAQTIGFVNINPIIF